MAAPVLCWNSPASVRVRPLQAFRLRAEAQGDVVPCNIEDVEIRRNDALPIEDSMQLEEGQMAYNYFLKMTVPGETTKEYMKEIEKDAKKNANFPGFRKGQIPPWAKPQLKSFCVETALNDGIMDAMESAKLTALDGENKKAEILEDVKELTKGFKIGTPLTFTATFSAKEYIDASPEPQAEIIDAEVAEVN